MVRRSGAKAGDAVMVSAARIGDAALGLRAAQDPVGRQLERSISASAII